MSLPRSKNLDLVVKRFIRFVANGLGLAVLGLLLFFLIRVSFQDIFGLAISFVIAQALMVLAGFVIHGRVTFEAEKIPRKSLLKYFVSVLSGAIAQGIFVELIAVNFAILPEVAAVIVAALYSPLQFTILSNWVFRRAKSEIPVTKAVILTGWTSPIGAEYERRILESGFAIIRLIDKRSNRRKDLTTGSISPEVIEVMSSFPSLEELHLAHFAGTRDGKNSAPEMERIFLKTITDFIKGLDCHGFKGRAQVIAIGSSAQYIPIPELPYYSQLKKETLNLLVREQASRPQLAVCYPTFGSLFGDSSGRLAKMRLVHLLVRRTEHPRQGIFTPTIGHGARLMRLLAFFPAEAASQTYNNLRSISRFLQRSKWRGKGGSL